METKTQQPPHSRWRLTSIRQLRNRPTRPQRRSLCESLNRPKHNSSDPFRFTASAHFRAKRLRSPSLLCHYCKRPHRNFIVRCMEALEAGLMLIRFAHPALPLINSRTFTMPLRMQRRFNWLIQQAHWDNRRYGQEFLSLALRFFTHKFVEESRKLGQSSQNRTIGRFFFVKSCGLFCSALNWSSSSHQVKPNRWVFFCFCFCLADCFWAFPDRFFLPNLRNSDNERRVEVEKVDSFNRFSCLSQSQLEEESDEKVPRWLIFD